MKHLAIALVFLALAGCASAPQTAWNPLTWFSRVEANASDRAEARLSTAQANESSAREELLHAAQRAAHESVLALITAPPSRAVDVASESATHAADSLDQALGSLPATTRAAIRAQVSALLSDNAALRAEGEAARASARARDAELSRALEATRIEVTRSQAVADQARADLRTAFDRENALANELRNERTMKWLATAGSVLATVAAVAYRLNAGGLATGVASAIADLRRSNPSAAAFATSALDASLDRAEQSRLSRLVRLAT